MKMLSKNFISKFLALSLLLLGLTACQSSSADPLYSPEDLAGNWRRIDSNKPSLDAMEVEVEGTDAFIRATNGNSPYFLLGQRKWRRIKPTDGPNFSYEDKGSNNEFYDGTMTLDKSGPTDYLYLNVKVAGNGNGNRQSWERF
ncbi:hypothetical protein [Saprospira grandis]|uniref:hypothetical protein n=1 Tax=Saprospira grandis TaxID=1008 RepID=UPI0022DE0466|nr:hypothetical protein [Saprospira grandis]WBM75906.1 hypothetical protein OP864_06630 [Saprospira grandis]